ncbi:MAG: ribonuclease H family protein [Dysgonamonadaceae bacterium]|nr:ribonuclease H family protein [Dysgonamonadaceae bacterium]
MAKGKWYVVWNGVEPGIYDSWEECRKQISGFDKALYKSFASRDEAVEAFRASPWEYIGQKQIDKSKASFSDVIIPHSLSVDAACSGNPGVMEYRGVHTQTGTEIFRAGPFPCGTNNIGEFLAIVHGLALLKKQNSPLPIYSDSLSAIKWVQDKASKTQLQPNKNNKMLFDLINRAEKWLRENTYSTLILKWNTKEWGEIPADFGRK